MPSCCPSQMPFADLVTGLSCVLCCLDGMALEDVSEGCTVPGGLHMLALALVVTGILATGDVEQGEGFQDLYFSFLF